MYTLQRRFTHKDDNTLVVPNAEYLVFMGLMRYIYTDHLRIPSHLVQKLEAMATRFRVPRLGRMCYRLHVHGETEVGNRVEIPPSTFAEEMRSAINDERYSDIVFNTEDGNKIYAHKLILVSRCDYFPTIFEGSFLEKGASSIAMKEISYNTFLNLLDYIYSNEVGVTEQNFIDMLLCADRFLAGDMKLVRRPALSCLAYIL
jgi:hypothetical protein